MLVVGHSVLWWLIFSRWCLVTSKWAKKLPFSLLYNEEMSNWLVIERFPVFWMGWNQLDSQSSRNAFHSLSCSSNAYGRSFDCELRPREGTDGQGRFLGHFLAEDMGRRFKMHVYIYIIVFIYTYFYKDKELSWDYVHKLNNYWIFQKDPLWSAIFIPSCELIGILSSKDLSRTRRVFHIPKLKIGMQYVGTLPET